MKLLNLSGGGPMAMLGLQLYTTYTPTNCGSQVPDHDCSDCLAPEHGRVRSIAFILKSFVFSDPTNPTQWATGIANRQIIIIPSVNGVFDGGSEILGPGYGDLLQKLTGYNFKLTYKDPGYKYNADFYNAIKNSTQYYVAYRTETQIHMTSPSATIQVVPHNPVTDSLTDEVTWSVDVLWSDSNLPVPFAAPAGTFVCFQYN